MCLLCQLSPWLLQPSHSLLLPLRLSSISLPLLPFASVASPWMLSLHLCRNHRSLHTTHTFSCILVSHNCAHSALPSSNQHSWWMCRRKMGRLLLWGGSECRQSRTHNLLRNWSP